MAKLVLNCQWFVRQTGSAGGDAEWSCASLAALFGPFRVR